MLLFRWKFIASAVGLDRLFYFACDLVPLINRLICFSVLEPSLLKNIIFIKVT